MKKLLAALLCAAMLLSLAACASTDGTTPSTTSGTTSTSTSTVPANPFEGVTIKAFLYEWPSEADDMVREAINEALGFTVEWIHCPASEGYSAQERLLAADPTIDVFYLGKALYSSFRAKNMLMELSSVISRGSEFPALNERAIPNMENLKDAEGKVYGLPMVGKLSGGSFNGLAIRQDWLKEVGKELPTTVDELDAILAAFKAKYPDKYPLMDQISTSTGYYISSNLISGAFSPAGEGWWLDTADNTLKHPFMHPNYKDYVAKMAEWYQKGYLHPQFIETNANKSLVSQLMTAGDVGASFSWCTDFINPNMALADKNEGPFEFVPAALSGPAGSGVNAASKLSAFAGVNRNSKNLEAVLKFLDFMQSEEGTYLAQYGTEGKNYTLGEGGAIVAATDPKLVYQAQYNPYTYNGYTMGIKTGDAYTDTQFELYEQLFLAEPWQKSLHEAPDINVIYDYTGKQYDTLKSQVETFLLEQLTNTITGKRSVSDWDAGINEALKMGLSTMVEERSALYQASLGK